MDYRQLNSITIPDNYPLPRIDKILDKVADSVFITTLDLTKGYYQIPLHQDTIEKTAFITPDGKFEFLVLPFGLRNAPAIFQCMMDGILQDVPNALAYIDNIVIFSTSWEDHLRHLDQVCSRLKEAGLHVKAHKCKFANADVSFLGHVVGKGKVRPQQAKVQAVNNYRVPRTKTDLRAFLGLVGYYRQFIPQFSARSANLTDLTSTKQPEKLHLLDVHLREFEDLRKALQEDTVLASFNTNYTTLLQTDASDKRIGACLSQVNSSGTERPVAYYSRKLLARETRYTVSEKEMLAAVEAIKHFSAYLLGGTFTLVKDYRALTSLRKLTRGGARITRWALALQPFSFDVIHCPGKLHGNADGLS